MRTLGERPQALRPHREQAQLRLGLVNEAVAQERVSGLVLAFAIAPAALAPRLDRDVVRAPPLRPLELERAVAERAQRAPVALLVPAVPVHRPVGLVRSEHVTHDRAAVAAADAAAERAHGALEVRRLDREDAAVGEPLVPVDE